MVTLLCIVKILRRKNSCYKLHKETNNERNNNNKQTKNEKINKKDKNKKRKKQQKTNKQQKTKKKKENRPQQESNRDRQFNKLNYGTLLIRLLKYNAQIDQHGLYGGLSLSNDLGVHD